MKTRGETVHTRIEASVLQFFSPYGLLSAVALIILSVMLFSTSAIEMRTHDRPTIETQQSTSPLLDTTR